MATKKKKPEPVPPATQDELDDVANCFERWAKILRQANDGAKDMGSVTLSWKRSAPKLVRVQLDGAKKPDGFRASISSVLAINDSLERAHPPKG